MKTIYKYKIEEMVTSIHLPKDAKFLSAQIINETLCAWFLVDKIKESEDRNFLVFGTGWEILEENLRYLATVQNGVFVWHLFEELNKESK